MRKIMRYIAFALLLVSCQHELHFPYTAPVIVPATLPEKIITAIVVTDPAQTDYDSLVFRYNTDNIKEVHYILHSDSVVRTWYYDAAGRLSKLEDDKAIYYTNNNRAIRIRFQYNAGGDLQQTTTDFAMDNINGVIAYFSNRPSVAGKQLIAYDTAYKGAGYDLEWTNRIIYSTLNNSNNLLYDSAILINTSTTGLFKTTVNEYSYDADTTVTAINKRIYFNNVLSEYGTVSVTADQPAQVYRALHKKLYRNLANWFDEGLVWQDDSYQLFPLPGGPYKSILYKGFSAGTSAVSPPYTLNYNFDNSYSGDQLNRSSINYSKQGQGASNYTTVLRYYYKQ